MDNIDTEREKYQSRVEKLAAALNISLSRARKMLNSQAANRMFETDKRLQEWEKKNFPDPDRIDPNDN